MIIKPLDFTKILHYFKHEKALQNLDKTAAKQTLQNHFRTVHIEVR